MNQKLFLIVIFTIAGTFMLRAQKSEQIQVQQYLKIKAEYYKSVGKDNVQNELNQVVLANNGISVAPTFKIKDDSLDLNFTVVWKDSTAARQFLNSYTDYKQIEWVEWVPEISGFYTPNDYSAQTLWHLDKVNATQAWDQVRGDTNITIAIVDDAVLYTHEDLLPVIWHNSGEIPGNGIDDDGNGYIDDIHGWDAADGDNDPRPPATATASFFSHGTHCAGIATARTDNGLGVASLSFNCRLIAVKTKLDNSTGGTMTHTLQGIQYAIAAGARVVSMSFGGTSYSQTYQNLLNYGNRQGVIFIAAAGNSNNVIPLYPANYNHVISVGATDPNDNKATFSSYGAGTDVMAPGTNIYSSVVGSGNNQYGYKSGTSMACPLVAGLAGMMLVKDPTLTPADVEACLKGTAVNIDALNPTYAGSLGAGRIDAYAALICVKSVVADFGSDFKSVCPGGVVQFTDKSAKNPSSWFWEFPGGAPSFSTSQNPQVVYNTPGNYRVKLKVTNQYGADSMEINNYIRVGVPTAQISGTFTIPNGFSVNLRVDLQGEPPFRIKLNDGTNSTWITNISSSPYYHLVSPNQSTTYTIDSVGDTSCFGTVSGNAQVTVATYNNSGCNQATEAWQKHYVANNDEKTHSIIPCVDGGFLWVGLTKSVGAGDDDIFVTRLNDTGYVMWSKVVGSSAQEIGYSVKAAQTSDSGFVVIGSTKGFGSSNWDMIFFRFDKNGQVINQRRIGGGYEEYGRAIIQTQDGGFLLAGTTGSLPRTGLQDGYLVKLDSSGAIEWTRKRGFPGTTTFHLTSLIELDGGNVMALGGGDAKITPYVSTTVKVAPDGTIMQECRLQTSQFDALIEADRLTNGNIATVGVYSTNNGASFSWFTMVIDTNSQVLWAQNLSGFSDGWGCSISATSDGGFIVSGYVMNTTLAWELVNVKYLANGTIEWAKRYGTTGNELQDKWNKNICQASDGGYVFTMHSTGYNSQGSDLLLMKTDPCGIAGGCNEGNYSMTVGSLSFTRTVFNASANTGGAVNTINANQVDWKDSLNSNTIKICSVSKLTPQPCNYQADFSIQKACAGEATRFTDISRDFTGKQQVYSRWIIGSDTVSGLKSIQYIFPTGGNYSITLISGNNGSPSCYDTITKNVEIFEDLNIEIIAPDTVCQFDSVRLAIPQSYCGVGRLTYAWYPGNLFLDSADESPVFSMAASGWIGLIVRDSLGNIATDSHYVYINVSCCTSSAHWVAPNPTVCKGDSIHLVNSSITKTGASFIWSFQSGAQTGSYLGENPPSLYYPNEGAYAVQLISSDICGTDTFESNVYVVGPPQVQLFGDSIICGADSILFDGNAGFPSSITFEWSPATIFNNPYASEPTGWINQKQTIYVKIDDAWLGCGSSDSLLMDVENLDTLKKLTDTIFCFPNQVEVDYSSSGAGLLWFDNADSLIRHFGDSITATVRISRNNCQTYDTLQLRNVKYQAEIAGKLLICENDSGLFLANNPYDSLLWNQSIKADSFYQTDSSWLNLETYWYGCYSSDSVLVDQFNERILISGRRTICSDDSIQLNISNPGYGLLWGNGDTTYATYTYDSGYVSLRYEYMGCYTYDSAYIQYVADTYLEDFPDTIICAGDSIEVNITKNNNGILLWSDGGADTFRILTDSGIYIVNLSNFCNSAVDTIHVVWEDCTCLPYIPNAFTPNDDGLNDVFKPELCEAEDYSMVILDMWGEVLFQTTDLNTGWDGSFRNRPATVGAYVYLIQYKNIRGEEVIENGGFMLLRPKN